MHAVIYMLFIIAIGLAIMIMIDSHTGGGGPDAWT